VLELELPQPLQVAQGPVAHAAGRPATLPQQKLAQAVFGPQLIGFGIGAGTHQVPQGLMCLVHFTAQAWWSRSSFQ